MSELPVWKEEIFLRNSRYSCEPAFQTRSLRLTHPGEPGPRDRAPGSLMGQRAAGRCWVPSPVVPDPGQMPSWCRQRCGPPTGPVERVRVRPWAKRSASITPLSPLPPQGDSCPEDLTWRTKMLRLPMCCPLSKVTTRSPKSLGAQRGFDPGQGASNPAFLAAAEPRGLAAGPGLQGGSGSRSVSPEEPDGWKETGKSGSGRGTEAARAFRVSGAGLGTSPVGLRGCHRCGTEPQIMGHVCLEGKRGTWI